MVSYALMTTIIQHFFKKCNTYTNFLQIKQYPPPRILCNIATFPTFRDPSTDAANAFDYTCGACVSYRLPDVAVFAVSPKRIKKKCNLHFACPVLIFAKSS